MKTFLTTKFLEKLEAILGPENYSFKDKDKLNYSRDSNFRSSIKTHFFEYENPPTVITWPKNKKQISEIILLARKYKIPVVPFGAGSGVCQGTVYNKAFLIIDVKKLNKITKICEDELYFEVEPGISGLELEKQLGRKGYTLGHFPSSILCASVGGYLAGRSAGQLSSKYGKIEDLVLDLEFVDGTGKIWQTSDTSRAKGFDLTQTLVGSEGSLGIITKARFKLYPLPKNRKYFAFQFSNMNNGFEAIKRIMQTGIKPAVLRLYDEIDTVMMFNKFKKSETKNPKAVKNLIPNPFETAIKSFKQKGLQLIAKTPTLSNQIIKWAPSGCAFIVMLEGPEKLIKTETTLIQNICKAMNAKTLSSQLAQYWHKHRYSVSFKAPKLFNQGIFTDTMEVATTWDNMMPLYNHIKKELSSTALVLAHVSHAYPEGAAIYFSFAASISTKTQTLKLYDTLWERALKAVAQTNSVISHHHGVGRLKNGILKKQLKPIYKELQIVKNILDPDHILNPGLFFDTQKSNETTPSKE